MEGMCVKFDVIGLDSPCVDLAVNVRCFPKPNGAERIQNLSWQGGGKVASGMVAAARLGLCCGIMGNVGDDKYGTFCLRDFQDHGIDQQIKEAEQYIQIDVQQPLYSMVDRGFEDLMSWGYDRGIDSMTYGSMGAGILSGKIRSVPSFEKNDLRLNFYDVYKEPKFSKIMELLKVMDSIADGHNVPVGQVALNWSTQKEYVGTALVGVRSIEHADENCKTFDWKLTEEEMKILDSKIEECAL